MILQDVFKENAAEKFLFLITQGLKAAGRG